MSPILQQLLCISLCAAAISFTITTTSMFKWLRELVSPIHKKIEELIHCPWCLSHWIVFVIMLTANVDLIPISDYYLYNWLFTAFVIIAPIGLYHYVILRAYEPVMKAMVQRELQKLKEKKVQQNN